MELYWWSICAYISTDVQLGACNIICKAKYSPSPKASVLSFPPTPSLGGDDHRNKLVRGNMATYVNRRLSTTSGHMYLCSPSSHRAHRMRISCMHVSRTIYVYVYTYMYYVLQYTRQMLRASVGRAWARRSGLPVFANETTSYRGWWCAHFNRTVLA